MSGKRLPPGFAELEPFADKWCLATEPERWETRLTTPMPVIHQFYDTFAPRFEEAFQLLGRSSAGAELRKQQ